MIECLYDPAQIKVVVDEHIESRREQVSGVVRRIMKTVSTMTCAQENLEQVELALMEALANAVIHGNREHPEKKVHVWVGCEEGERLLLVITDEGDGFDIRRVKDPTLAENLYSTHGRGIFLMNRLMDSAEHRLGGRQVILRKRVRGN